MDIDYIHILGLSTKGQRYIKTAKKNTDIRSSLTSQSISILL